jgi:hypothetical protein
VRGLNNRGGVDGHPLKLIVCDDAANPTQDGTCAREIVAKHVARRRSVGARLTIQRAVEDEVRRSHRVRPNRGPTQQFMRSLRADATLGGTSCSISPPNVAISLTPLELKKL